VRVALKSASRGTDRGTGIPEPGIRGDCKDAAAEASTGDAPYGGVGINPDQGPDPIIYAMGPNAAFSY